MALSDFQTFNDFAYRAFAVTYQQQVNLFNAASRNGLMLTTSGFSGDYKQKAAFENLSSLVGNRDPSSTAAATTHALKELLGADVKVGWGTPNIDYTDTSFDWTNRSPELAGTAFGNQIAEGAMAYALNSALSSLVAALDDSDVTYDGTAGIASLSSLNQGAAKFGDRQSEIAVWVMHSKSVNDIYENAIQNSNRLFTFGSIRVVEDGMGRPLIMTDSPALFFDNSGTNNYHQIGLVSGGAMIEQQGAPRLYEDLDLSEDNAKRILKAEGAFAIGVKGYKWNTAVTKPDDAAIALASNWSRITDLGVKDCAGVVVTTL